MGKQRKATLMFNYTSRIYTDQDTLLKDLNKYVEYEKTIAFFTKCKGLHSYFEKNKGSLDNAIANAERSMQKKEFGNRDYTYSQLGELMRILEAVSVCIPTQSSC